MKHPTTDASIDQRQPTDLYDEILDSPLVDVTPETRRRARLTCAMHAIDARDLAELLSALNLYDPAASA